MNDDLVWVMDHVEEQDHHSINYVLYWWVCLLTGPTIVYLSDSVREYITSILILFK